MTRQGFVYVAEAENGMVKIGYSCDPVGRVKAICSGSPIRVRLIAIIPAKSRADERVYHRNFASSRAWNEWFHPVGELREFLNTVVGTGVERVVDWGEIISTPDARGVASKMHGQRLRAMWADPVYRAGRTYRGRRPNVPRPAPTGSRQTIEAAE